MNLRIIVGVLLLLLLAVGYFFFKGSFDYKISVSTASAQAVPLSPPVISSPKSLTVPAVTKSAITRARRVYFLRQLPSEEAVVLSETTDGVTTISPTPDYWQLASTQEKLDFINDQISTNGSIGSADILSLFQNEKDSAVRLELLSAATLPDYDANIQSLFSLALRPDQPADLRVAALVYAADADPSIAAAFQNDANPALRLAAQGLLNARPAPHDQPMSN